MCNSKWDAPLLITGCARSGTTALARALSTHADFCIFNEYHLYFRHPSVNYIWNYIQEMRENNSPPESVDCNLPSLKTRMLAELPEPASNEITRSWLFDTVENPPPVYGDKMPYRYLAEIHHLVKRYPKVKFLITIRDGRAVVASQIRQYQHAVEKGKTPAPWMQPSVKKAEYLWLRSMKAWLQLRTNPPAPCLEVRYEQAVRSPENLAKKISDFVGIDYLEKEFEAFLKKYHPVHEDIWRKEITNIEEQLSDEFLDALSQLGFD